MRNELIINQGVHASLWRSLMSMNATWNMSGWLVQSVSPPLTSIQCIDNMLLSTSWHILHNDSMDCSFEPCRLCLRPVPLCKIVSKMTKGHMGHLAINMKLSLCLNLVKFSITKAAMCFKTSPCTNYLMKCPYGPKSNPAVWSYNFHHHLLYAHPSIHLGSHKSVWTPSKLKKDEMKHV
jgi:hypothetical protein